MTLLTPHDFETATGQRMIIAKIHTLEQRVHELSKLVHECLSEEERLEKDFKGYD